MMYIHTIITRFVFNYNYRILNSERHDFYQIYHLSRRKGTTLQSLGACILYDIMASVVDLDHHDHRRIAN